MSEVSELQQEALLIREIPQRFCASVTTCKDLYKDVFSVIQVMPTYSVSWLITVAGEVRFVISASSCPLNRTL